MSAIKKCVRSANFEFVFFYSFCIRFRLYKQKAMTAYGKYIVYNHFVADISRRKMRQKMLAADVEG